MQTIYAFTQGYDGDKVQPFWRLAWPIGDFIKRLPDGLNRYWYADATRFIPFTIHEFQLLIRGVRRARARPVDTVCFIGVGTVDFVF